MFRIAPGLASGFSILGFFLVLCGCGSGGGGSQPEDIGNQSPNIALIDFIDEKIHASENVGVQALAEDPDGDGLAYLWSTTRGTFPNGRSGPRVVWRTPELKGMDTLTVRVTDFQDTVFASVVSEMVLPDPPESLWSVAFSNQADVEWLPSIDEKIEHWQGYLVYAAEKSLAGIPEDQLAPYRITPAPITRRAIRFLDLEIGRKYFFHVRGVREYGSTFEQTPMGMEIDMSPRPEGNLSQFLEIASGAPVAFDISRGRVEVFDPANDDRKELRDLILDRSTNDRESPLILRSVSHLSEFDDEWLERPVVIKSLGFDWEISSTDIKTGWVSESTFEELEVFAIRTPDGHYGKFQVTNITGFAPRRIIWLRWAYQTIPDYPRF